MDKTRAPGGRVVIVTGAGTGLGVEIARAFVEQGDDVVICGRTLASLEETAAKIAGVGSVTPQVCDVSDEAAVRQLVDVAMQKTGRIDVLVNNAGVYGPIGLACENSVGEWRRAMEINLFGVFLTTRFVAPRASR